MLGDLMMVLSHAGRVQDAATVLQKLDREQTSIVGAPDIQAVEALFNMALLHQTTPVAVVSTPSVCCRKRRVVPVSPSDGLY